MTFAQAWAAAFPDNMWILLVVCAVLSAIGFYKFVYFLSIGYGFAISGAGAALLIMYLPEMGLGSILQCALFVLYGIRLGGFLLFREMKNLTYRKTLEQATKTEKPMPIFVKAAIWICVALLYVAQVSPVYYRIENGMSDGVLPLVGAAIMAVALLIETVADAQKSAAKKVNPKRFCDGGLYKIVRCPNYLGEILFWTGVFVSCFGALVGAVQWIIAAIGFVAIVYIMFSGAKRLETRQNKNYGEDPEYRAYTKKTPIILPLVPIYSLVDWKFIK